MEDFWLERDRIDSICAAFLVATGAEPPVDFADRPYPPKVKIVLDAIVRDVAWECRGKSAWCWQRFIAHHNRPKHPGAETHITHDHFLALLQEFANMKSEAQSQPQGFFESHSLPEPFEWSSLKEAADYLARLSGNEWTEKRVADAFLKILAGGPSQYSKCRRKHAGNATMLKAALPLGTKVRSLIVNPEMDFKTELAKLPLVSVGTITLYANQLAQLLAQGKTIVSSGPGQWEGELLVLENDVEITLADITVPRLSMIELVACLQKIGKIAVAQERPGTKVTATGSDNPAAAAWSTGDQEHGAPAGKEEGNGNREAEGLSGKEIAGKRSHKEWSGDEMKELLNDLNHMSQENAGKKWGVSKARIQVIEKRAKAKFTPAKSNTWLS